MKLFGRELEGFAKALVVFVAMLLVTSGLCGMTNLLEAKYGGWYSLPNAFWGNFLGFAGIIVGLLIMASAIGIAFTLVAWPIAVLYRRITNSGKNRARNPIDGRDDESNDSR